MQSAPDPRSSAPFAIPPLWSASLTFLSGLAVAGLLQVVWPPEFLLLFSLVPLAALWLWRDRRGVTLFLCGLCFLLGLVRYQAAFTTQRAALTRYHDSGPVTLQGVVASPPDVRDRSTDLRVEVTRLHVGADRCAPACDWLMIEGTVLVHLPRTADYHYGDQVELTGALRTPPELTDFSYRAYLAQQGIYSLLDHPRSRLIGSGQGNPLWAWLFTLRDRAHATISQSLPEPQASLLTGVLLGIDRDLPDQTREAFNRTGTTHILALSGYNIAIAAGFFFVLARLIVRKRHAWALVTLGIILYVVLVGASASVTRAGIMAVCLLLGPVFGRRAYALDALILSADVMALHSPYVLWSISFQLSFAATLAIILLATRLDQRLSGWVERRVQSDSGRYVLGLGLSDGATGLAATVATLPIIVYNFHTVAWLSLLVNALVLPAQPAIMGTGLLVVLGGMISPALGQAMGWLAWPFLAWTTGVVEGAAALPFAALETDAVPLAVVVLYVIVLVAFTVYWLQKERPPQVARPSKPRQPRLWPLMPVAFAGLLLGLAALSQPDGLLHLTFVSVRGGEATLVKTPSGRLVVLDGGPSPNNLNDAIGRQLPFYSREVALVVLNRAVEDKLTGLIAVLERYHVAQIVAPPVTRRATAIERWNQLIAQQRIPVAQAVEGLAFDLGDGTLLTVAQVGDEREGLALRLDYGQSSFYFDLDRAQAPIPQQHVVGLRLGYYAEAKPLQPLPVNLIEALSPQLVISSARAKGGGENANPELSDWLWQRGIVTYSTDVDGTVEWVSDGQQFRIETRRSAQR
ncbi:MAG: ComEC/Rec2 family competence protein [Chloroflexi bacterium]|nr:ComEC/Rec2 family competence protein [Chloroflexota bacterium]